MAMAGVPACVKGDLHCGVTGPGMPRGLRQTLAWRALPYTAGRMPRPMAFARFRPMSSPDFSLDFSPNFSPNFIPNVSPNLGLDLSRDRPMPAWPWAAANGAARC